MPFVCVTVNWLNGCDKWQSYNVDALVVSDTNQNTRLSILETKSSTQSASIASIDSRLTSVETKPVSSSPTLLPLLTFNEANQLLACFASIFIIVFLVRRMKSFF